MKKQLFMAFCAVISIVLFAADKDPVVEFREAYEAGNLLVADRIFRQFEATPGKFQPEDIYHAAMVAKALCNGVALRDRFMYYGKAEKNWTPELEYATWWLCDHGGNAFNAKIYARLAENVKSDGKLYWTGLRVLDRLRSGKRGEEFVGVIETMFAKFGDDKGKRNELMRRLFEFKRDTRESPGFPHGRADALWRDYPCPDQDGWKEWSGWFGDNFDWIIGYAERHAKQDNLLPPGGMWDRIHRISDLKDAEAQKKLDARLAALKPEILRLKSGWYFYKIMDMAFKRPGNYYPGLEGDALKKAIFDDLMAGAPYYDTGIGQNLSWWAVNDRKYINDDQMWQYMNAAPNCWYVDHCGRWAEQACNKAKSFEPMKLLLAKMDKGRAHTFAFKNLGWIRWHDSEYALQVIRDHVYLNAVDFNYEHVYSILSEDKLYPLAKRNEFLCELVKLSGCPWRFDSKNALREDYFKHHFRWLNDAALVPYTNAVAQLQKAGYHPANNLSQLRGNLNCYWRGDRNLCDTNAHPVVEKFVKLFAGKTYPKLKEGLDWKDRILVDGFLSRYYDMCIHNYNSRAEYVHRLLPFFGEGYDWGRWRDMWGDCWRADDKKVDGGKWHWEGRVREAQLKPEPGLMVVGVGTQVKEIDEKIYPVDKFSNGQLYNFIRENCANWNGNERTKCGFSEELAIKLIGRLWARGEKDHGIYGWWETMDWMWPVLWRKDKDGKYNEAYLKLIPWEAVMKGCVEQGGDWNSSIRFLNLAGLIGKKDEYSLRLAQAIAKSTDPYDQIRHAGYLCRHYDGQWWCSKAAAELVYGEVVPAALKKISDADAPQLDLSLWGLSVGNALNDMARTFGGKVDEAYNKTVMPELFRLQQAGMRGLDDRWPYYAAACAYDRAVAATNVLAMTKAATLAVEWGHWSNDWAYNRMSAARKAEQWQILYLMANNLGTWNINDSLRNQAGKWRAEAATKLPGIYPVNDKHPAYPLFIAADELNRNNSERAWELLRKSTDAFAAHILLLPADFAAWGLEQLRMARGANDALLLRARDISTKLLEKEKEMIPLLAAACIYTIAESYRDQLDLEEAKPVYDRVTANPAYVATPYGRKALFRSVDLMIEMGNQQGAEQIIEAWLSQPDVELQIEAHYFLAKIAFDRQDYDECMKELRKVFEADYTHTEARFLHGQWKLATNHEVDETDVQVGSLSDRKIIRPGQQLAITVQDRNLSVAGGGASIPVIVKTNPGGDFERLQLYPSSRDPTLFRGVIEARLAAPVCSNMYLEVCGQDIVSYQVDPEFAKSRALEPTPPKELTIVDDGALLIGTGAPRTDGSNTVDALTRAIEAGAKSVGGENFSSSLRPGNPVYIAVKDLDRSFGGSNGTVTVELGTSSGDRIPELVLKETKPYSGVFRGSIPSALPPPRAYASDSAAGANPGDVINSTRDGVWTSVADGKPGKWFAVDTMGSHVVSNATLTMRTPKEIKGIRLSGALSGDLVVYGSIPAGKVENRDGLRVQMVKNATEYRSFKELKNIFAETAKDRPEARKTDAIKFTGNYKDMGKNRWQIRFSGAFERPAEIDYLRLRVKSGTNVTEGVFKTLSMSVYCDGEQAFSGKGAELDGATFNVECSKDVHLLEIYASAAAPCDDFELVAVDKEGEEQPFDVSIFDRTKHPDITTFLEDAAVIARTESGFKAVFRKNVRLRTIRWDFLDVVSPDVQASAMTLMDVNEKMVLPVKSDFSDAQRNSTLEVAPGDTVFVKYRDDITANGQKRVLQQNLNASFNNATIGFSYAQQEGDRVALYGARRFRPGDRLVIKVSDSDADQLPGRDQIKVKISTNSGVTKTVTLLEDTDGRSAEGQCHSGTFSGNLRTQINTDTNNVGKVLLVSPEDVITIEYEDRENTSPGVPVTRSAKLHAVQPTDHELTLFQVRKQRVIDNSPQAAAKLAALRRKPGNEGLTAVYSDRTIATAMTDEEVEEAGEEIPMNIACPIPVRVTCLGRAIHNGSSITLEATAESEIKRAEEEGEEPYSMKIPLKVTGAITGAEVRRGYMTDEQAWKLGAFAGSIPLELGGGASDDMFATPAQRGPRLAVSGSDRIRVRVIGEDGSCVIEKWLKLVANGSIAMMDSSWTAERHICHVGEKLYIMVKDEDRDESGEADEIIITAKSTVSGVERNVALSETLPHSGIFTGAIRPIFFPTNEEIPVAVTSRVDDIEELLKEDRFSVSYGDSIVFTYEDENHLPDATQYVHSVTGSVHKGANGSVRLFSKRFRDNDEAVLVQFRLAECLFEQAKEFRKLKQQEKSAAAIEDGKRLLEEALKNYPDSVHAVEGEYLLANLYQELAAEIFSTAGKSDEEKAKAKAEARPLYAEALARFSVILSTWPDCALAPRSQYHKALCLERLDDWVRAGEEYVKMTYLYPESDLVGDATIRLATYYFQSQKRYDIAAKIYCSFARRFPDHEKAAKCLFMSGSCFIKQAEEIQKAAEAKLSDEAKKNPRYMYRASSREIELYKQAVEAFDTMGENFRDTLKPEFKAQAMYWAGHASFKRADYPGAYLRLKRCVFEFPETEWGRRARGLLLQEAPSFEDLGQ